MKLKLKVKVKAKVTKTRMAGRISHDAFVRQMVSPAIPIGGVLIVDPDNTSMMISCDKCNVWQHGPCMGIWGDDDAPDGESLNVGTTADK